MPSVLNGGKKKQEISQRRKEMIDAINGRLHQKPSDERYSLDIDAYIEAENMLNEWRNRHAVATFQEELLDHISERGMTSVDFYKKAHMDRKLFSAINGNRDYTPKKETAVACCLSLELSLDETKDLLEKAGLGLSDAKQWDVLITHCISCGYYDIDDVNFILDYFGEKSIGY